MRVLFFILVLLFASAPFFMAQADEASSLKCLGATALQEDQMPFATGAQNMIYERDGGTMKVSIAGQEIEYKEDEKFDVEESETLSAVRVRATGAIVLSVEKVPLMQVQKRWGAKAKYVVRGVDPRNGQDLEKPIEVVCEKKI